MVKEMVVVNVSEAQTALAAHIKDADVIRLLDTDTRFVSRFRQQEAEGTIRHQIGVLGLQGPLQVLQPGIHGAGLRPEIFPGAS